MMIWIYKQLLKRKAYDGLDRWPVSSWMPVEELYYSIMFNDDQIKFDPFTHSSYLLINGLSSATSWYEWFEEASDDSFSLFFLLVSLLSSLSLLSSSSFVLTLYRPSIFKMMTSRTVKERESNVHHSTPTILIPIQIINPSMLDNDWWYYLEH